MASCQTTINWLEMRYLFLLLTIQKLVTVLASDWTRQFRSFDIRNGTTMRNFYAVSLLSKLISKTKLNHLTK